MITWVQFIIWSKRDFQHEGSMTGNNGNSSLDLCLVMLCQYQTLIVITGLVEWGTEAVLLVVRRLGVLVLLLLLFLATEIKIIGETGPKTEVNEAWFVVGSNVSLKCWIFFQKQLFGNFRRTITSQLFEVRQKTCGDIYSSRSVHFRGLSIRDHCRSDNDVLKYFGVTYFFDQKVWYDIPGLGRFSEHVTVVG